MKRATAFVLAVLFFMLSAGAAFAAPTQKKQLCIRQGVNSIVCLTLDDGFADRARLQKVLGLLRSNHVKCTFFIIGNMLMRNQDLWRQAIRDGNEICYHTMTHKMAVMKSPASILRDIAHWNKTASQVLGQEYHAPKFARLPGGFGDNNPRIAGVYQKAGYKIIGWNVDPLTGAIAKKRPGETCAQLHRDIARYVKNTTKQNSIILLHFDADNVYALPLYIGWLKSRYKLGTISEALAPATPPAPKPALPAVASYPPQYAWTRLYSYSSGSFIFTLYPWMNIVPFRYP